MFPCERVTQSDLAWTCTRHTHISVHSLVPSSLILSLFTTFPSFLPSFSYLTQTSTSTLCCHEHQFSYPSMLSLCSMGRTFHHLVLKGCKIDGVHITTLLNSMPSLNTVDLGEAATSYYYTPYVADDADIVHWLTVLSSPPLLHHLPTIAMHPLTAHPLRCMKQGISYTAVVLGWMTCSWNMPSCLGLPP